MYFNNRLAVRAQVIKRINKELEDTGLSKAKLALKMGVSKQNITNVLSCGGRVSLERLFEICKVMGLKVKIIF